MSYCPAGPHGLWLAEEHINSLISEKFEALEKVHYDQNLTSFIVQEFAKLTETIRDLAETATSAGDYYKSKVVKSGAQRLIDAGTGFTSSLESITGSRSSSISATGFEMFIYQLAALTFLLPLIILADAHRAVKASAFILLELGVVLSLVGRVCTLVNGDGEPSVIVVRLVFASALVPAAIFLVIMITMLFRRVIDTDNVVYWCFIMKGQAAEAEVVRARVDERRRKEAADRATRKAADKAAIEADKAAKEAAIEADKAAEEAAKEAADKATSRTEETGEPPAEKAAIKAATTSDATNTSERTPNSGTVPDVSPEYVSDHEGSKIKHGPQIRDHQVEPTSSTPADLNSAQEGSPEQ